MGDLSTFEKGGCSPEVRTGCLNILPDGNGEGGYRRVSTGDGDLAKESNIRIFRIFADSTARGRALNRISGGEINHAQDRRGKFG